jgi:hypothetical protein
MAWLPRACLQPVWRDLLGDASALGRGLRAASQKPHNVAHYSLDRWSTQILFLDRWSIQFTLGILIFSNHDLKRGKSAGSFGHSSPTGTGPKPKSAWNAAVIASRIDLGIGRLPRLSRWMVLVQTPSCSAARNELKPKFKAVGDFLAHAGELLHILHRRKNPYRLLHSGVVNATYTIAHSNALCALHRDDRLGPGGWAAWPGTRRDG